MHTVHGGGARRPMSGAHVSVRALDELRVVASGLDHPEGVASGLDGMLYAGGEAGQVYRIDPVAGEVDQIADTKGSALGICLDGAGSIFVCDSGNHAVMRVDAGSGSVERWCDAADGQALAIPNWAAFSSDGSLWLSDSGTEAVHVVDGRLLRVPPGGGDAEVIDTGPLHFPNGLCIGPGDHVYLVESFTPRLRRLTNAGMELIAQLPEVVPDGVAIDREGFIVSCYYPFRLLRVSTGGQVEVLLDDPLGIHIPMPTNIAHFGHERDVMAIACLGGYEIKALPAPAPGQKLVYP